MTPVKPQPRLPSLFIVGAPKCGTTAWAKYLGSHPDVFFPESKDHCYFALDLPNFRLTRTAPDYAKLFSECGDSKIVGEASAMYLFSQAAAEAIHKHDPASKILIFLRDQTEFLPSLHNQFLWEFAEEIEDFATAWKLSGKRPPESIPKTCLEPRTLDYAAMGRFDEQVERYLARFPADQIRVIRFRDWVADPRGTYLEILDFLGLEDDGRSDFPNVNPGASYRSRTLARLVISPPAFLREDALRLKRVTGPLGRWLHRAALILARRLSTTGYRKGIDDKLCNEIRAYYADDNRRLQRRLEH